MQPGDYGPFPYVPINRRPKWHWPNGARLAVWVIPNLEFFSLNTPLAGHPFERAHEYKAPTVRAWGQRDYGNRVGVFRMMDVLTKHGIRATATTNADMCDHHPEIIEDAVKLGWEFMGHNKTNSTRLSALEPQQERELIRLYKAALKDVANHEKFMPRDFISADGFHITDKCRRYLSPLIGGGETRRFAPPTTTSSSVFG